MKKHHHHYEYYFELRILKCIEKELLYLIEILKKKEMDATQLQQTITNLEAAIVTDQTQLDKDNADLATAQAELAQVSLVNALEALTADQVTAVNEALASDSANTTGITLTLPAAAAAPAPTV